MKQAGHEHSIADTILRPRIVALCVFLAFTYSQAQAGAAPGIAVQGKYFVTTTAGTLGVQTVGANQQVVLRGVNLTGTEYACLDKGSTSVWDTIPSGSTQADYQATINAILSWHANVVRIPLNEDCWLGLPTPPPVSGSNYITPIQNFIKQANQNGLIVEVDLHVGAGPQLAKDGNNVDSFPAMDTNYSKAFWMSVAQTSEFGNNPSVIFNLTNEPQITSWSCYLDGGSGCTTAGHKGPNGINDTWNVEGTQDVVTAIRDVPASNPIIIAGLDYSNQLNDWLQYVPIDSLHQIIAGVHIYFDGLDCENTTCWSNVFGNIQANNYPVVIDETGEFGCKSTSEQTLTNWADTQPTPIGYWFWAFTDLSGCSEPALLKNAFTAVPSYGTFVESHLKSVQ